MAESEFNDSVSESSSEGSFTAADNFIDQVTCATDLVSAPNELRDKGKDNIQLLDFAMLNV